MRSGRLDFALIFKRLTCKNSAISITESKTDEKVIEKNISNSERLCETVNLLIEKNSKGKSSVALEQSINKYMNSMCNTDSASAQWYYPLQIAEKVAEKEINGLSDYILDKYTESIIPYIDSEGLNSIKSCLEYNDVNISADKKSKISSRVAYMEAADRIILNHENLSKRFNMDNDVRRYDNLGIKYFVDSCCMKVDTYSGLKPYQKMNLAIEECTYLLQKNKKAYDESALVRSALQFFLLENPYLSKTELNTFKRAIAESYIISEDTAVALLPIIYPDENQTTSIEAATTAFYTYPNKTIENLTEQVKSILYNTSKYDIIYNFDKLLYFLWDIFKSDIIEDNEGFFNIFTIIGEYLYNCTKLSDAVADKEFSREEMNKVLDVVRSITTQIDNYANANSTYSIYANKFINNGLTPLSNKLDSICCDLYTESNLENIRFVNSGDQEITLEDYNKYFKGLYTTADNFDKFLRIKESKMDKNLKANISGINSTIIKECSLYSYIGSDNRAEITVRQYITITEASKDMVDFLDKVCNEYNDIIASQKRHDIRCYYTLIEGAAEIRIKDSKKVLIPDDIQKEYEEAFDVDMNFYEKLLEDSRLALVDLEDMDGVELESYLTDFNNYDKFNKTYFDLVIEALKYTNISDETINVFAEKYNSHRFATVLEAGSINDMYSVLAMQEQAVLEQVEEAIKEKPEMTVPYNLQAEATFYAMALLENMSDDWDDEDEDDEDDEEEKPSSKSEKEQDKENEDKLRKDPKYNKDAKDDPNWKPSRSRSKISLTKLKLGIKGLHQKFKDMSNKEKELSRNLDNSVRALVKSMKSCLVSDRREAIIKGSLIPSFSRCIKNGIALAGVGAASGAIAGSAAVAVTVPAIIALGGIAMSKRLTKKERMLLLDDIETELDVVEKELAIAESNNKMNQYRALLQYKKELQRQYQRIRYNIRVGKDILPGSSTGVPSK